MADTFEWGGVGGVIVQRDEQILYSMFISGKAVEWAKIQAVLS